MSVIRFFILAHDPVIRKLSFMLLIIRSNFAMGTAKLRVFFGMNGRAETSNMTKKETVE